MVYNFSSHFPRYYITISWTVGYRNLRPHSLCELIKLTMSICGVRCVWEATKGTAGKLKKQSKAKPSEEYANFEKLAKELFKVPKAEIDKREAKYQHAKKAAKKQEVA